MIESNSFSISPNCSILISSSPFFSREIKPNFNNEEALKLLNTFIEDQKNRGYKYPLISCVFVQFYKSGKQVLEKSELYSLVKKEVIENKNKIISSPTERYCIIDAKNYKSRIKDIIKKKNFFSKNKEEGKIEYSLNPGIVSYILPKIISDLKVLVKNSYLYKDKENNDNEEKEEEKFDENNGNIEGEDEVKEKKRKRRKRDREKKDKKNKGDDSKKNEDITDETRNNNENDFDIIINDDSSDKEKDNIDFLDRDNNNNANDRDNNKNNISIDDNSVFFFVDNNSNDSNNNNSVILLKKKRKKPNKKNDKIPDKVQEEDKSYELSGNCPINNSINEKTDYSMLFKNNNASISLKEDLLTLNNKIDSISNIGEMFLNYIKNENLSDITSKKLDLIEKSIELKKKSIESDNLLLNNLVKAQAKIKSIKAPEIQEKIEQIQKYYKQYKELIDLLLLHKNVIENLGDKEDSLKKKVILKHKKIHKKCKKILKKMLSGLSLVCQDYESYEEIINMLYADEDKGKKYLNVKEMLDVSDLRNMFRQALKKTDLDNNVNINNDKDNKKDKEEFELPGKYKEEIELLVENNQLKNLFESD